MEDVSLGRCRSCSTMYLATVKGLVRRADLVPTDTCPVVSTCVLYVCLSVGSLCVTSPYEQCWQAATIHTSTKSHHRPSLAPQTHINTKNRGLLSRVCTALPQGVRPSTFLETHGTSMRTRHHSPYTTHPTRDAQTG